MRIRNLLTLTTAILAFYIYAPVSTTAQNLSGLLLTVNNNGDSSDANPGDRICADSSGRCTLRAAIEESNAGSARNAIIFDLPQPAVIDLTLGELTVVNSLDMVGPGARRLTVQRSTIAGTPNFRIFHLPVGQARFNIRGITIKNGNDFAGGGLFIQEGNTVGLYDVAITGNRATAGGGIANFATLSILRSLLNSNIAVNQGGAITSTVSSASLTITSSTLTENSASFGGALDNVGNAVLINNTISLNTASSGSSSIFSNPLGNVKVMNTIIGRDIGQTVPALQGQFQSLGNNIVTAAGPSTGFTNGVNGDQVSQNNAIDPLLGTLANNGGQTNTLALQTGSPAIDSGNDCAAMGLCPQLPLFFIRGLMDQRRNIRRLAGSSIDIGAFEVGNGSSSTSIGFEVFRIGPAGRYLNSIAIIINPTTLEKYYRTVRLNDNYSTQNLPSADVYVIEIRAKRRGVQTPVILAFD